MRVVKFAAAVLLTVPVAALQACSTGCDREAIGRALAFINAHQTCATAKDCVVIPDCGYVPGGSCGLALNRQAAQSPEWTSLAEDLDACSPDSCPQCDGLLTPTCVNGCCTEGKCGS